MKSLLHKLKCVYLLLKTKRFILIFVEDNKDEDEPLDWRSYNLEIEEVPIILDLMAEEIDEVIQAYVDETNSEYFGNRLIDYTNRLN